MLRQAQHERIWGGASSPALALSLSKGERLATLDMLDGKMGEADGSRMHGPSLAHRIRVEAHAVWLAARDPRTPLAARLIGLFIAAYALSPLDFIPDFIPVLGLLDEAVLIPAGMWVMTRMIPPALMAEHRAAAERAARRPVSWGGIAIVLMVWAVLIWLVYGWIAVAWD